MQSILIKLKILFTQLFGMQNTQTPQGLRILTEAKKWLGKDASPANAVDKSVACAESLTNILKSIGYMDYIITGTYTLLQAFLGASEWVSVTNPLPGDVILYASGTGNGSIPGHTGIILENNFVASNNSNTGIWDTHLNLESMRQRYEVVGGFPRKFFRRIL